MLRYLKINGLEASKIKGIRVVKRDRSGRAMLLQFITKNDSLKVKAEDFRKYFGFARFRSEFIIRIVAEDGGYVFMGKGWGHGSGLCQEGVKEMARRGWDYRRILRYYYPTAQIELVGQ